MNVKNNLTVLVNVFGGIIPRFPPLLRHQNTT